VVDRVAPRERTGGDGALLGKRRGGQERAAPGRGPHTDGWRVQTSQRIIATAACRASTVHYLRWGHFQAPQWGHFQAHAHI